MVREVCPCVRLGEIEEKKKVGEYKDDVYCFSWVIMGADVH